MIKLGLVLSGGGVKGVYHLGVLQYLKEQGIEFDVISATSAGSIVGTLVSLGLEPVNIKEALMSVQFKKLPSIWSIFGKAGLINPHSMKEVVNKDILNMDFTDYDFTMIQKELYITATNMESGRSVVFSKNSNAQTQLLDAMMASSAYPFVFSPMEIAGVKYSDGGILSNFPVEVIKDKVDYVLGVYLSPVSSMSGDQLDSSKAVVLRALSLIGKEEEHKFKYCNDVLHSEELSNYQTFEFDKKSMQELYDLGYNSMKNEVSVIKRLKQLMRYNSN